MIICAALEVQVEGLPYTTILPCWRHGKGYEILRDLGYQPKKGYKVLREGFMNHKGEFLDRKEALKHTLEVGQLSATTRWYQEDHKLNELYSEDLY
jgi:hypothetical protein